METAEQFEKGPSGAAAATLGDVLYAAKSKAAASESEWLSLVRAMAAGDQGALHALYQRTHRLVFTLIVRITGSRDAAEALTVEVFQDLWRGASAYDPAHATVVGWVMNQARSRAVEHMRGEGRKKTGGAQGMKESPDLARLRQQSRALRAALVALTPEERQVLETAFFSGMTQAEVAARLNQPLGTVKARIRSGLHKLRHLLATDAAR